MNGFGGGCGTL